MPVSRGSGSAGPTSPPTTAGGSVTLPSVESVRAGIRAYQDCLRRHGVESELLADMTLTITNGDQFSQSDAEVIGADCQDASGGAGATPANPDDHYYELMYESALDQVACLAEQGYPITWEVTEETFIEQMKVGTMANFPYTRLRQEYPEMRTETLIELNGPCPQFMTP